MYPFTAITYYVSIAGEGKGHTLDEGLGEGACPVTVTVGCFEVAGAVLCGVTRVNTGDTDGENSTWEDTGG